VGGDDGRPSRGLVLRARDPVSDARSRQWRGGRRRQREEAGRRQRGGGKRAKVGRWRRGSGRRRWASVAWARAARS
jgi:hypothetical protein